MCLEAMPLLQPPFSWKEFTTRRVNPGHMPEYEVPRSQIVLGRMSDAHNIHVARFDTGSASRHRIPGVRPRKGSFHGTPFQVTTELIIGCRWSTFIVFRSDVFLCLTGSDDGADPCAALNSLVVRESIRCRKRLPASRTSNLESHV